MTNSTCNIGKPSEHSPLPVIQEAEKGEILQKASGDTINDSQESKEKPGTDQSALAWDGDDDPENPKNWPEAKKWRMVVVLSFITFLTSVTFIPDKKYSTF